MSAWVLAAAAVLEGFAVLPAHTLAEGPPSGMVIDAPGLETPFSGQPVQGVSALAAADDGSWWALVDNGFGARANSEDFLLRIYRVRPEFRTAAGGAGTVEVLEHVTLNDDARPLTGADYDPESLVRVADGSFWMGDEFGPFLLHVEAGGGLLEPPIRTPGVVAPEYADGRHAANLPRSKGFEGLGVSPDGATLYPMLEGSLPGEDRVLRIFEFEIATRAFRTDQDGDPVFHRYPLDDGATAIGALRMLDETRALVIERDSGQGAEARFKKVFEIALGRVDVRGLLVKRPIADLLDIADPHDLDGDGSTTFRFDHQTTESIVVLDDGRLLIVNDNNYPFGRARSSTEPDPTEFIVIRPVPVGAAPRREHDRRGGAPLPH